MAEQPKNIETSDSYAEENFVRKRLEEIEGDLLDGTEPDTRLQSGIPNTQRANDLDFIQMTGLTRPGTPASAVPAEQDFTHTAEQDIDTSTPLSFYEKGVSDVDHTMPPSGTETSTETPAEQPLTAPEKLPETSAAADAFRDIISELTHENEVTIEDDTQKLPPESEPVQSPAQTPDLEQIPESGSAAEPPETPEEISETTQATTPEEPATSEKPEELSTNFDQSLTPPDTAEPITEISSKEVSEDFDTFLAEDMAVPEAVEESASEEPAPAPTRPPAHDHLAEAEQLLQKMQTPAAAKAPAGENKAPEPPVSRLHSNNTLEHTAEARMEYDYSAAPVRRRSKRHSRRHKRTARKFVLFVVIVLCGGLAVVAYKSTVQKAMIPPDELHQQADSLLKNEKYEAAGKTYARILSKDSNYAEKADVLFDAAFSLRMAAAQSPEKAVPLREEALGLLKQFVQEHPHHIKRARVEGLIGILHFELGHYAEAIATLQNQARQVADPIAALPLLRALAESFAMLGQLEEAESFFLQAAVLPKNYQPDYDYERLGTLFAEAAEQTTDPQQQAELRQQALKHWQHAFQLSGINPAHKKYIEERVEQMTNIISATENPTNDTAPTPEEIQPVPVDEAVPVPAPEIQDVSGVIPLQSGPGAENQPSPASEAEYLEETL